MINKISKILSPNLKRKILMIIKVLNSNKKTAKKLKDIFNVVFKTKIYKTKNLQGEMFSKLFKNVTVDIKDDDYFVYFIDFKKLPEKIENYSLGNLTVDYSIILDKSLIELKESFNSSNKFDQNMVESLNAIELLVDKIIENLKQGNNSNKNELIHVFEKIKTGKIDSTYEAIQKVLFYNQVLWQADVMLLGLGRLDYILDSYYQKDKNSKRINDIQLEKYILEFYNCLHKHYESKSAVMLGDTGQVLILGGVNEKGEYFSNKLTYKFIECLKQFQKPDPKIVLRVSKHIPKELLKTAIDCINTGVGSPLLANDDRIIPKLLEFGYDKDSYNYGVSACWEPFFPSKSSDQNNVANINFLKPLNDIFEKEDILSINSFDSLLNMYEKYLSVHLKNIFKNLDSLVYNNNSILTIFYPDCIKKKMDIGEGGAKYNDFGATSFGFPNTINSLLNIKNLCFETKIYTLKQLNDYRVNNYNNGFDQVLKANEKYFGNDDSEVIELTNRIVNYANSTIQQYKNKMNGRLKFGLCSPSYVELSNKCLASFDGRKNDEPFAVHISSERSSYTELFNFEKNINYTSNGFNGNVIDFMVSPSFITDNYDKFVDFIHMSIENGFFEMQMNVVSSKILIEAKNNPNLFPNLIVRVWGFSAYFNELPESYKDLIIRRAIENEYNY